MIPFILCGGQGARLAPTSTPEKPKQFLPLGLSGTPMLLETIERIQYCTGAASSTIHIVTLSRYVEAVHTLAPNCPVIEEKTALNTGPAIALSVQTLLQKHHPDTLLWICPSDHVIERPLMLKSKMTQAGHAAQNGSIVTFGIPPTHPETGYGYIRAGADRHIDSFTEKPDAQTAQRYIESGQYYWNSGMFLATLKTLQTEFDKYVPDILTAHTPIPFDKAIMEKTDKGYVIPCPDLGWADIGTATAGNLRSSVAVR